jgi:hypothetical protein
MECYRAENCYLAIGSDAGVAITEAAQERSADGNGGCAGVARESHD